MKVLVIGGGGREHALAWKLAQSQRVQKVYVAPGNGGTATEPGGVNVDIADPPALAEFAAAEKIGLTVVGPEAPLAAGVVDVFRARGLRIFGPTRAPPALCDTPSEFAPSMSSMAAWASASVIATTTPLPAARPSALTTMGAPLASTCACAAAGSLKVA